MCVRSLAPVLLIGLLGILVLFNQRALATDTDADVPWRQLLEEYGKIFSVHFTIQRDETGNDGSLASMSVLQTRKVARPSELRSLDQFLDAVRQWVPEAEVRRDDQLKNVYHIVEKSLTKKKADLLDQKIDLTFEGPLGKMVQKINDSESESIEVNSAYLVGEPLYDLEKEVKVNARDLPRRTILASAVSEGASTAILWEAFTSKSHGKFGTSIRFMGTYPSSAPSSRER